MRIYEVGGCVRDEILGVKSKDIDFTVVLDEGDFVPYRTKAGKEIVPEPYEAMERILRDRGFTIYPVKGAKENFTIRGRFPDYTKSLVTIGNREYSRRDADFVLARVEGPYSDGRRPDWVKPGTLTDDLRRRDFTMNAIAKNTEGHIIDPFNGRADIDAGIIRAVGDPHERMAEDALRVLRALRFSVTKDMTIDPALDAVLRYDVEVHDLLHFKISAERKREELNKMFGHNTMRSMGVLNAYPAIMGCLFADGRVSLEATMKARK